MRSAVNRSEEWLNKVKRQAKSNGGKCLSNKYINAHTKLDFICARNHQFSSSPANVLRGVWCAKCASIEQHKKQRTPFQQVIEEIKTKNGKLQSSEKKYIETGAVDVKCQKGHEFSITWAKLKAGSFCLKCSYESRGFNSRLDISTLKKIAKKRGGKLISNEYLKSSSKYEWECRAGHRFESSYSNVREGTWCPQCSRVVSISERVVKAYMESFTGLEFKKVRPQWLVSDEGTLLELDGYNEQHKVAFEHHGTQHYIETMFYDGVKFSKRKRDDEIKEKICRKHGIRLLVVDQLFKKTSIEDLKNQIVDFCNKNSIILVQDLESVNVDINSFYNIDPLDNLREICAQKRGRLITKRYEGYNSKLEVICAANHKWSISVDKLKSGQWCPECKRSLLADKNRKYSILDMKNFALKKGGKCLSENYKTNRQLLKWECKLGHQWESNFANISMGKWCKKCASKENGDRKRDTIDTFHQIAKLKRGALISKEYLSARHKLTFKCSKGHVFERIAYDVKKKNKWCHKCKKMKKMKNHEIEPDVENPQLTL